MHLIQEILLVLLFIFLVYKNSPRNNPDAAKKLKPFLKQLGPPLDILKLIPILLVLVFIGINTNKFEFLDLNQSICSIIISFIFSCTIVLVFKNNLLTKIELFPGFRFLAFIGISVMMTIIIWGSFEIMNGKLDKSEVKLIEATVLSKSINGTEHRRHLHLTISGKEKIDVEVGESTWDKKQTGAKVSIKIKSGFFHIPWIVGFLDDDIRN